MSRTIFEENLKKKETHEILAIISYYNKQIDYLNKLLGNIDVLFEKHLYPSTVKNQIALIEKKKKICCDEIISREKTL